MHPNAVLLAVLWLLLGISGRATGNEHFSNDSLLRKRDSEAQRQLLFRNKNAVVEIVSPAIDSSVRTIGPGTEPLDVEVSYNDKSLLGGLFETFTQLELLMDSEIVGKKSNPLGRTGKETFSIDMGNVGVGKHKLQARGTLGPKLFGGIFQRKVLSDAVFVNIECNPDNSFLYFTGHDEVTSLAAGAVNVTWSPALAFGLAEENFIWCGPVTYDVLIAEGIFDFSKPNVTGSTLIAATTSILKMQHFETSDLKLEVTNLVPGNDYSVLVLAKTDLGHSSHNRGHGVISVATTSPVLKSNFTRMVILPEPSETFQVQTLVLKFGESRVSFKGVLPSDVQGLQPLDFVYFFDSDGNATMAQLVSKVEITGDVASWIFHPADLGEVFDELDMNVAVSNPKGMSDTTDDWDDEDVDGDDIFNAWTALDENVKRDICKNVFPDSTNGDCFSTSDDRRLAKCGFVCRQVRSLVDKAKSVAKAIKSAFQEFGEDVKDVAKRIVAEKTLKASVTFLDIARSAKLSSDSAEIGIHFDATGVASFKIRISLAENLHRASLKLEGGFGVKGYVYMVESLQRSFQPAPLELLRGPGFRKVFLIGPVPVLLTNRPKLSAFLELDMVAEGQALVSAAYGYDYVIEYSYNRRSEQKFKKTTSFKKRHPLPTEPEFALRLNAQAEIGFTFQWDVLLYELLQGSIELDLALASEMQVGTNVDAMVVTKPYFYTLDKFRIDLLIRIRMMLGFNNDIQKIIRKTIDFVDDASQLFRPSTFFKIPDLNNTLNELPEPLRKALILAKADSTLNNAMAISLNQLDDLVPDPFTSAIGVLKGFNRNFGLSYVIFSEEIFLFGLPEISLKAAPQTPEICKGDFAISLKIESDIETPAIPFRDGIKNGRWYANFDGKIFHEDTAWQLSSPTSNVNSVDVRLPRSASKRAGFQHYEIQNNAVVYLRATPEILPVPYGMYEKAALSNLFTVPKFECCVSADCPPSKSVCDTAQKKCYATVG